MTRIVPSLLAAALAAALGSAAHAADVPLIGIGGGFTGSFVQTSTDLFIDTFTFSPASAGGLVSVTLMNVSGTSFFTASLNDQNFSFLPELGRADFSFQATLDTRSPVTLTVFGAALDADGNLGFGNTATYRGTINVAAAVPEPEACALLLAGLGGVATVGLRRRKAVATA